MSYFTLRDGNQLYYEDTGEKGGRTLVFLHGWTSSHKIFSEPVKRLSKQFRCISYDHRGHGRSRDVLPGGEPVTMKTLAEDLHELLTGLEAENIVLCGWSMGSGVVMEYLRDYGDDALDQIVLCDMTPKQLNDDTWHLGLRRGRYTAADMEAEKDWSFMDQFRVFSLGTIPWLRKLPPRMLERGLERTLSECNVEVLEQLAYSMKIEDYRPVFEDLHVPLTYFFPDPGSIFLPELVIWYRQHVPTRFRVVRFRGCTHMLIAERPGKFAEEMARIVNTTPVRA